MISDVPFYLRPNEDVQAPEIGKFDLFNYQNYQIFMI